MSDTAYPKLTSAENAFKSLVWDLQVKAALTSLGVNIWPLNSIFTLITDKVFDLFRTTFDLKAIAFVNAEHKQVFDKASVTLMIIEHDKGPDSPEYTKANDEAKAALSKFVRFGATL